MANKNKIPIERPFLGGNNGTVYLHFIPDYGDDSLKSKPLLVFYGAGWTEGNKSYYLDRFAREYMFEYIISGTGYIECDGEKYKVSGGDCVIVKSNQKLTYYASKQDPYSKLWFTVNGTFLDAMYTAFPNLKNITIQKVKLRSCFENIIYGLHNQHIGFNGLSKLILEIFSCVCFGTNPESKNNEIGLSNLLAYIDLNIGTKLTLETTARYFGMTPSALRTYISDNLHFSYQEYVMQRRLAIAAYMLLETDNAISVIALSCGFFDQSHFSNSFKRKYGVSPSEYRGTQRKPVITAVYNN